jgi:hypothetical protein
MGQATGIGAAMAVKNSKNNCETRDVDIAGLQRELRNIGAYLPNVR